MISICIKNNNPSILNHIITKLENYSISNMYYQKHSFKIFDNIIIHYKGKNINEFCNTISEVLFDTIIKFYEPIIIRKLLNSNYFYFDKYDCKIILDEFKLLKEKNIYDNEYVKDIIVSEILEYFGENNVLILSGFVNFRLYKYTKYLESMVSESVNQYIIDKEYISFVNLLSNYVNSKKSKDLCVHLVYVNSLGLLLSSSGEQIELDNFSSSYVSDISFSQNDYVLNTLVGMLPKKIILHLVSPRDQFIKTIEMIFSGRIQICTSCDLCRAYKF